MASLNREILIVEDEKNLGITLTEYLQARGHHCQLAVSKKEAQQFFFAPHLHYSIVLLDIGLPDGNGIDLAQEFRRHRQDFVLLFLSALNDPSVRLQGLEMGGDDYITKPFDLRELTLRLDRILQTHRGLSAIPHMLQYGPLKIWFQSYQVAEANGQVIPLSQKECAILQYLHQKQNQVVGRDEIIENIWGSENYPSNRTVDNYIVKLRKWCESDPQEHIKIISVRGIGYKLSVKE